MNRKSVASLAAVASIAAMLCGAPAASAVPTPAPSFTQVVEKGLACKEFALSITSVGSRNYREFEDRDGNVVNPSKPERATP